MRTFTFGGKTSAEFGIYIINSSFPPPEKKEMSVDLPFTSGELDFSYINGEWYYTTRQVLYSCFIKAGSGVELQGKIDAATNWLLENEKSQIEDTDLTHYHFEGKCISVTPTIDEEFPTADIEIIFKCDPYRCSEDMAQLMAWDDLTFDDYGYINPSKIVMSGPSKQYVFKNILDVNIPITVSFEKKVSNIGITIYLNGEKFYIYSPTADPYQLDGLELKPGDNDLKLEGMGTITFTAKEKRL